jgi:DNA-directed RNA polymerase subunit N (RpoN/RPB10)
MLYLKCPSCHKLLGNKQIYYEENYDKITKDLEMGKITSEEAEKKKIELLDFILPDKDRYCCRMRVMTYKRLIEFVK